MIVENGYLEMDIYDKNMHKTAVDLDKLTSTSNPNTYEAEIVLEPSTYSVVLSAEKFQGMYHLLKINQ